MSGIWSAALPLTQQPVRLASGPVLHPDLAWPEFRVAVEYDWQWHADADQLHRDRQRLNQLVTAGWLVLHVTGRRLYRDFTAVEREVRAARTGPGRSASSGPCQGATGCHMGVVTAAFASTIP